MNTCETFHRTISHGQYAGMVETIKNKDCPLEFPRCTCGHPSTYYSVITDSHGALHSLDFMCAFCAREQINGILDRAGKSPYQSLDPRKERRRLQDRKNAARERRKESMARVLFGLVIGFAYLASAAFIVSFVYMVTKIFTSI